MTSGVTKQDAIIVGCTQIRWLLERSAEIYPRIVIEPVGGTGLKATGSDTSRSRDMCSFDKMYKKGWVDRPN